MHIIRINNCTWRERFGLVLCHSCGLLDALIGIITWGVCSSSFRARYLCSDLSTLFDPED